MKTVEIPSPIATEEKFDIVEFIILAESGNMSSNYFHEHAQAFVDDGRWRMLQGSWGRAVRSWADAGLVTLN